MRNVRFILSNLIFWLRKGNLDVGDVPLMPSVERDAYNFFVEKATHILEYGGGGSTIWITSLGKKCTCVENSGSWIEIIENKVESKGQTENLNILFANTGVTGAYGMPVFGNWSCDVFGKGLKYVLRPYLSMEVNKFDMVFIDGRWRVSCCLFSAIMLPADTPILLDDFERSRRYEVLFTFFEIQFFGRLAHLKLKEGVNRDHLLSAFSLSLRDAE